MNISVVAVILVLVFYSKKTYLYPLREASYEQPKTDLKQVLKRSITLNESGEYNGIEPFNDRIRNKSLQKSYNDSCRVSANATSIQDANAVFLENFVSPDTANFVMYIKVRFIPDLPYQSSNERNRLEEWQWVLEKNYYYSQYPVDLDVITFYLIAPAFRDNEVILHIENQELCDNVTELEKQVRDSLWKGVFQNHTKSYLCNRNFENNIFIKEFFYYLTWTWGGYDLSCSSFQDQQQFISVKAGASFSISITYLLLALFYPMLFKIIELRAIKDKIEDVLKNSSNNENKTSDRVSNGQDFTTEYHASHSDQVLRQFNRHERPFGFIRCLWKIFYRYRWLSCCCENGSSKSPRIKAVSNFSLFLGILLIPASLYRTLVLCLGDYSKYEDVYRVGLPRILFNNVVINFLRISGYVVLHFVGIKMLYHAIKSMTKLDEEINESSTSNFHTDGSNSDDSNEQSESLIIESFREPNNERDVIDYFCFPVCFSVEETQTTEGYQGQRNEDDEEGECCFRFCKTKPVSGYFRQHYKKAQYYLSDLFIHRFMTTLSRAYWRSWKITYCENCDCNILCGVISIFNIFISFFPFGWLLIYGTRSILSSYNNKACIIVIFLLFVSSQWVILSAVITVIRIFIYSVFIVLSVSIHNLRIVVVIILTLGYMGSFYTEVVNEYKQILDILYSIKDEGNTELSNSEENGEETEEVKVTEDYFNEVIDAYLPLKENAFWSIIKTIFCFFFFIIIANELIKHHNFDDNRADYILQLVLMAFSPKLLFKFLEPDKEEIDKIMKSRKDEIRRLILHLSMLRDENRENTE